MFDLFTVLVSAFWLDCFVISIILAFCPVVAPFKTNDLSLVEASESVNKVCFSTRSLQRVTHYEQTKALSKAN